jgi:hypothetical protein
MYSYWIPKEFWDSFVQPAFYRQMATVHHLSHPEISSSIFFKEHLLLNLKMMNQLCVSKRI